MANPQHSVKLQALWDELAADNESVLEDCPDSTCTTGSDNDGSSGFEIFENGFELAEKAAGRPVFYVDTEEDVALFFIGTEDEIAARLTKNVDDYLAAHDDGET
jgi:hypothetical protein